MDVFCLRIVNEFQVWIKLLLVLMSILKTHQSNNTYSFLTAMQQTNETFMAYLPFLENCNYATNPNISQGSILVQTSTP